MNNSVIFDSHTKSFFFESRTKCGMCHTDHDTDCPVCEGREIVTRLVEIPHEVALQITNRVNEYYTFSS